LWLVHVALIVSVAHAQSDGSDVQAAARAFQDGQRAQLRGNSADAARLYELADSLAPTPEAVRSAIRSQLAAGHEPRAGTLALAAQSRYPEDAETSELASEVLTQLDARLARVAVQCDAPCAVLCDGRAVATDPTAQLEFFVEPGAHTIEARFGERREIRKPVDVAAGERLDLRFAEPPTLSTPTAVLPAPDAATVARSADPASDTSASELRPWLFWTAAGLTAVVSGAAVVSGVDTLDRRDAYRAAPTRRGYERGVDSQLRTNALLVGAGALLATTLGLAFFTDWDGEESLAPSVNGIAPALRGGAMSVSASPDGAALVLNRSFE
jgi:hypothetical protein